MEQRASHGWLSQPQIRVALVVAGCLLIEAAIMKDVVGVRPGFFEQLAALWIFVGWQLSGRVGRASEFTASLAAVAATTAILLYYAF